MGILCSIRERRTLKSLGKKGREIHFFKKRIQKLKSEGWEEAEKFRHKEREEDRDKFNSEKRTMPP